MQLINAILAAVLRSTGRHRRKFSSHSFQSVLYTDGKRTGRAL